MTLPKLPAKKAAAVIVGVLAVSVGVFFGFRAITGRAAAGDEPQNVVVGDINENSATVTWTSGIEVQCTLEYGTAPTALTFFAPEQQASTTHSVKLTLLSPSTPYYFQIRCADEAYTNGGVPWSFSTTGGSTAPDTGNPEATGAATPTGGSASQTTTAPTSQPRPQQIQTIVVPKPTSSCPYTSCETIKSNLGKGCSTQDYFLCLKKPTPTP